MKALKLDGLILLKRSHMLLQDQEVIDAGMENIRKDLLLAVKHRGYVHMRCCVDN